MISNTRDIDTSRRCKFCDVVLTDENQYPSMRKGFVCKVCHNKRSIVWQKAHYVKTENDKNVPDRSVLCRMYVDERKTLKDIGDIYDTSGTTVRNWLKANKITLRTMSESWDIRREKHNEMFTILEGVDREKTIERFGYDPVDISCGSDKLIVVVCPDCGKEREIKAHGYKEGQCCVSCAKIGENHPIWGGHSAMLGRHHSEESKLLMGKKYTDEDRIKMSCTKRGIGRDDFDGFSKPEYCNKFNEKLKKTVRDKYDNCDFMSGLPDSICNNGRKLDVHHVDYSKQQGCNGENFRLVPLSRANHSKTNHNRFFWNMLFIYALGCWDDYYISNKLFPDIDKKFTEPRSASPSMPRTA